MPLDILTIGEALVEVMRADIDQPLDQPGPFTGPYPSGAPFIFAAQAARLGLRVGAIGAVGADAFGDCLARQMRRDGVNAAGLARLQNMPTGVAFVAYNADGSRDFVFSLGAGGMLRREMLLPELFAGLRCLHVMGSTLSMSAQARDVCREALDMARAAGALISFDPNLRPQLLPLAAARECFAPFIAAADILLPTAEELLQLTGAATSDAAAAELLAQRRGRIIVMTRGANGCAVFTDAARLDSPGFAVTELDPTGAGDCFDAGFLCELLRGQPLAAAARYANACGALAVTAMGPMAGARPRADVEAFLARQR